jgi:preprotein translocase subunit SecG
MFSGFLLVVLVLVCIAMAVVILLQRSEGGALGMGGGPSGFMTARGAGDLLTRTTSILAGVFFVLCLLLTLLSGRLHQGGSVVDRLKVNGLTPEALGRARSATPAPVPATPPSTPGGSAADIGVVTPPPGAAFEAPRPQVHTAPAVTATPAPPTAADNGANRRSSNIGGLQTAPQSTPTVAPLAKPFPNQPATAAPAADKPAAGNVTGGQ